MLNQDKQDLVGTASNRFSGIPTYNPLKPWEEMKLVLQSGQFRLAFVSKADAPQLETAWTMIIWATFNDKMNDLNDGKDRLILMGTLFIVLFLFLL